jgi:energy-coupling factor transporter transmembrane protein EcfT
MIDWFLSLEPVNRILVLTACATFVFLIIPGVKINLRNIVKAILLLVAALLLFTYYTKESPKELIEKAEEPPAVQQDPISVPQYYKDPEKRWQEENH